MSGIGDFYGLDFEVDFSVFDESFEDIPAVYVIYSEKVCLEVGQTTQLKTTIETHPNTREWIKLSNSKQIFVAFHFDADFESRVDKQVYLKSKLNPVISGKLQ